MITISDMHEYQNMNAGGLAEIDLYLEYVKWAMINLLISTNKMAMIIDKLIIA